jgi:hypothetical protein
VAARVRVGGGLGQQGSNARGRCRLIPAPRQWNRGLTQASAVNKPFSKFGADHRGAPGPLMGAGLPVLLIGGGIYWIVRRRKSTATPLSRSYVAISPGIAFFSPPLRATEQATPRKESEFRLSNQLGGLAFLDAGRGPPCGQRTAMTPNEYQLALELALRARWLGKFNNLSAHQIDRLCARGIARRFPGFSKFQVEQIIAVAAHCNCHGCPAST